jgi:hypothetical protein
MHLESNLLTGSLQDLNSQWLQLPFQVNSLREIYFFHIIIYGISPYTYKAFFPPKNCFLEKRDNLTFRYLKIN